MILGQQAVGVRYRVLSFIILLFTPVADCQEINNGCSTPHCKHTIDTIIATMDTSADPCEDFEQFSCGGYFQNYEPKPNVVMDSRYHTAISEIEDLIRKDVLSNQTTLNGRHSKAIVKAKTFYNDCMDIKTHREEGVKSLIKLINKLGSWTVVQCDDLEPWDRAAWSFSKALSETHKVTRKPSFWHSQFSRDPRNPTVIEFELEQNGLTLQAPLYYDDKHAASSLEAYLDYAVGVGEALGGSREIIRDKMTDVFAFEQKLAKIFETSATMYISFAELFGDFIKLFNWKKYLAEIYGRRMMIDEDTVILKSSGYFKKLVCLIKSTDNEILANYMVWSVIHGNVNCLPDVFLKAEVHIDKIIYGYEDISPRETRCTKALQKYFEYVTSAMFLEKNYEKNNSYTMHAMIDEIQHEFIENLNNVTWLDDKTREAVKEKAIHVKKLIGYPDWILDVQKLDKRYNSFNTKPGKFFDTCLNYVAYNRKLNAESYRKKADDDEWPVSPQNTVAHYLETRNAILIPAGYLRYPLFSTDYPKPYLYGGTGMVCGHEFTHGFDSKGRLYTKDGGLSEVWWTNSSTENFKEKASCLVEFFSSYNVKGVQFDGTRTLGENIADSGGLKFAYKAYKAHQQRDQFVPLPGLNLTADQMFFLGFSQSFCMYLSHQLTLDFIQNHYHTIPSHRILGTISMSKDFAEAFNCKPNSKMNPVNKCEIW